MKTIALNLDNFENCEFGISQMVTSESGNKFYWVHIYTKDETYSCATSESFTALLGENADDDKLIDVILDNEDKFEVANIVDEKTTMPACFDDGTFIYCIRKRAHRKMLTRRA